MTEEEAKTKWCPMARCGNMEGCNRNGEPFNLQPYCIASACMMWRWKQICVLGKEGPSYENSDHGYCGLGGGT